MPPYPSFKNCSSLLLLILISNILFAQSSKDGSETISATGVIFNRYASLASSATASATTITVDNISNLAASAIIGVNNNPYTTDVLGYGDLLMLIKMQGATITTTNDATYGGISSLNNTGIYELKMVQSIAGNVITLSSTLTNAFTVEGTQRVQVVRIPRLTSLTINSGASLTGSSWDGTYKGGIVAMEVAGNAVINGSITANGIGFRGGQSMDQSDYTGVYSGFVSTLIKNGSEKGESIAGYQADYDALGGRYARGASANGGGGGNFHNAGGGGGANAGVVGSWTGNGIPDISGPSWATAWDLEAAGFSSSASSGGGRGGYTYSSANRDAITVAPGTSSGATWGGDLRRIAGGLGGRPLTYSSNTLFMGGGGGGGDQNQSSGTSGAYGGGIIYLAVTGTVSGTGNITANGATAANSLYPHKDGLGGGGGGGAIKLNVQGTISGISLYANGGNGGSQLYASPVTEAEGPGGGGGCGYIGVVGSPSITMTAASGVYGTTNSTGLTEFIPNGATSGSTGTTITGLSFTAAPETPLPVRLECFDMISLGEEKVQVNWIAYDEVDVLRYELEQSNATGKWSTLVSEPSQAGNNIIKRYSIIINRPAENAQYRLKSVDKDGSLNYTCTKTLKASALKSITVAPSNGKLYISHPNRSCHFNLYNNFGQRISIKICKMSSTSTTIEKNNLATGFYYLQVIAGEEKIVYRFVQ